MTQIQSVEGPYRLDVFKFKDDVVHLDIEGPLFHVASVNVPVADLLAALGVDARPWVEWDADTLAPEGARIRKEYRRGLDGVRTFIHPDDVPDPDADLIERMAQAAHESRYIADWTALHPDTRKAACDAARAALAVIREEEK